MLIPFPLSIPYGKISVDPCRSPRELKCVRGTVWSKGPSVGLYSLLPDRTRQHQTVGPEIAREEL